MRAYLSLGSRSICTITALVAFIFAYAPSAFAQTDAEAVSTLQFSVAATDTQREGLIHLDVASRDNAGKLAGVLTAADITLLEDRTPVKILSFARSNPHDVNESLSEIELVLDEVDLSPAQFDIVKTAAINFLRRDHGILAQLASILWIKPDGVYSSAYPSADGLGLAREIESDRASSLVWKFHPSERPTLPPPRTEGMPNVIAVVTPRMTLWSDVLRTVYALAVRWRNTPGRKALVWLGYGWYIRGELVAPGPFPILVELATRIREARMAIYQVNAWPDPDNPVTDKIPLIDYRDFVSGVRSASDPALTESPVPHFALPVLATQSGGLVLGDSEVLKSEVVHHQDLAVASYLEGEIARCVADASDFYTVSFDPHRAVQSDEFHELSVSLIREQVPARTSYGYYNQPVFYDQPSVPEQRLTVAALQQLLTSEHDRDRKLAAKLNGAQLTERLSTTNDNRVHGKESRSAFTALGDASVFLAPPAADLSTQPAPDDDTQRQIIQRSEKYLDIAIPSLPDFSADAVILKYEQTSDSSQSTWKSASTNRTLTQRTSEQTTLLYRNGREQQIVEKVHDDKPPGKGSAARNDLSYKGIFGPILAFVLEDVRSGNSRLLFTRWEQSGQGKVAVFRYSVRAENPKYGVDFCCLTDGERFKTLPEHHGEITIDPDSGAILRITVQSDPGWIRETDLTPLRPVLFSNMMVEYGPTDIGGHTFICPRRSVVITRERTVRPISFWGMYFSVYGPYQTLMNDTTYTHYHKFGSESKILPGFEVVQ